MPAVPSSTAAPYRARGRVWQDDGSLVTAILAGDEEAFLALVERHHGAMLRVACAFVKDTATAEEVVQDAWTAVLVGLSRFEQRSSLKTWIFRILANRAQTRGTREARSIPFSALEPEGAAVDAEQFLPDGHWREPPHPWEGTSPEAIAGRTELLGHLAAALDRLPAKQRAVVVLRDVEGLSSEEVCNVLEVQETHQRVLLHRGRTALREALEAHLGRESKR